MRPGCARCSSRSGQSATTRCRSAPRSSRYTARRASTATTSRSATRVAVRAFRRCRCALILSFLRLRLLTHLPREARQLGEIGHEYELDAPVLLPPAFALVARDRIHIGVAGGREALRLDARADEELDDGDGTRA